MPAIRDQKIHRSANFVKEALVIPIVTATNQSGVVCFSHTPGYRFQIVKVTSYCLALVTTVSAQVKVGTRQAVATVSFTAATEVAQTLNNTTQDHSNIRGSSSEAITVNYTTGASGALTNGSIVIQIRPWPLDGELGEK